MENPAVNGSIIFYIPLEKVHETLSKNIPLEGDGRWLARVKGQDKTSKTAAETYAGAAQTETTNRVWVEKYDGDTCVFGTFTPTVSQ